MEWISVKDRLPKEDEYVVVWGVSEACSCSDGETPEYNFAKIDEGKWCYGGYDCKIEVTHWMKPEPPKE